MVKMQFCAGLALLLVIAVVQESESRATGGLDMKPSASLGACPCDQTYEYRPVCGTDKKTYPNIGNLDCDNKCNVSPGVQLAYEGVCKEGKP